MLLSKLVDVYISNNNTNNKQDEKMSKYEEDVSIGELIRNCCVNLGLQDFDTIDGITINVNVFIKHNGSYIQLKYDPYKSLKELLIVYNIDSLHLLINQSN